jgi:hypothetical protein
MRKKRPLAALLLLAIIAWWAQAGAGAGKPPTSTTWTAVPPVARLLGHAGEELACQSAGGPSYQENVLPGFDVSYLNQIALSSEGSQQCGVASAAMILATYGELPPAYEAIAGKANELWETYANPTYVSRVVEMLGDHGMTVESACLAVEEAWQRLTASIDCGAPSILVSTRLTRSGSGHFFVAAGYRQEDNRRQIVAYDPYGYWQGPEQGYLVNSATPDSRLGEAVSYNFDEIWGYGSSNCSGGYLLTIRP